MTTDTKVDRAWKLLEQTKWVQGAYAIDADGDKTATNSESACGFCTLGAIQRVYPLVIKHPYNLTRPETTRLAMYLASHNIGCHDPDMNAKNPEHIVAWNDNPDRTKDEVISLLKQLDI